MVGDVFRFSRGLKVPADGIMLEGENVQCDESALSGENLPEDKAVLTEESMEQGAKATVFAQTIVNMGQGIAIATAVGVNTAAGRIQNDSDANKKKDTPLQLKLTKIAD